MSFCRALSFTFEYELAPPWDKLDPRQTNNHQPTTHQGSNDAHPKRRPDRYTVGSGQFQMTSLDTAGKWIYFICPAVILYFRFIDKYGDIIAWIMRQELSVLPSILVVSDEDLVSLSLVLSLAMITAVGVPLLNSLCPMGGYLFSRAYTHGQANTKKNTKI